MQRIHWQNFWKKLKATKFFPRYRPRHFRTKVMLLILGFVIIPVSIIILLCLWESSNIIDRKTQEYLHDISEITISRVDDAVYQWEDITLSMVGNLELQNNIASANNIDTLDKYDSYQLAQEIQEQISSYVLIRQEVLAISIVTENGSTYTYSKNRKHYSFSEEALEKIRNENGKPISFLNTETPETIIVGRSMNQLSTQKRLGYIVMIVNEEYICDIYNHLQCAQDGDACIVDGEGRIVSSKDKSQLGKFLKSENMTEVLESKKSGYVTIDNQGHYLYESETLPNSWRMVLTVPASYYMQDIQTLQKIFMGMAVVVIILIAVISFRVSKTLTAPLVRLSESMKKFGQGDFEVNCIIKADDEISSLSKSFNTMVKDMNHLMETVYQQQLLNQEAELKSLQMQINPHFLYNTLETINWMAREGGNREVGEMTVALGKLMRFSLSSKVFITMREEVENLRRYFSIQKVRYCDKLDVEIIAPESVMDIYLPKLLIQPIAENAIVHGIEEKIDRGSVCVEIQEQNGDLVIEVRDDGVGMKRELMEKILSAEEEVRSGNRAIIGLYNVNKRIQLYYGKEYGLDIHSEPDIGTTVILRLEARRDPPNENRDFMKSLCV